MTFIKPIQFRQLTHQFAPMVRVFAPRIALRTMSSNPEIQSFYTQNPIEDRVAQKNNSREKIANRLSILASFTILAALAYNDPQFFPKKPDPKLESLIYALEKSTKKSNTFEPLLTHLNQDSKDISTKALTLYAESILDELCDLFPESTRNEIEENLSKSTFTGPDAKRDFDIHVIKIKLASEEKGLFLNPDIKFVDLNLKEMYLAYKTYRQTILRGKEEQATSLCFTSTVKILPPEIGDLKSLKHLTLMSTDLTELPPQIGNLSNLVHLCLDRNKIRKLPDEIGQLASLQTLSIHKNHLRELPSSLKGLKSLKNLDVSLNQFETFPSVLSKFHQLENLKIYGYLVKGSESSWDDFTFWEKVLIEKIERNNPGCDIQKDYVETIFPQGKPPEKSRLIKFLAKITL